MQATRTGLLINKNLQINMHTHTNIYLFFYCAARVYELIALLMLLQNIRKEEETTGKIEGSIDKAGSPGDRPRGEQGDRAEYLQVELSRSQNFCCMVSTFCIFI